MCLVLTKMPAPVLAETVAGWPFVPSNDNMTNGKIKSGWTYIYSHYMGTFRINDNGTVSPSRIAKTPFYMEHLGKDKNYIHAPNGGYLSYKGNSSDVGAPIIISDKPCTWIVYVDNSDGTIRYVFSPDKNYKYFIKTWGYCNEKQDSKITLGSILITAECKFTVSNYVSPETMPEWWEDYKSGKSAPTNTNQNQSVYVDIDVPAGLANTNKEEWMVLSETNIMRAQAGLPLLVTYNLMQKMAGVRVDELIKS